MKSHPLFFFSKIEMVVAVNIHCHFLTTFVILVSVCFRGILSAIYTRYVLISIVPTLPRSDIRPASDNEVAIATPPFKFGSSML